MAISVYGNVIIFDFLIIKNISHNLCSFTVKYCAVFSSQFILSRVYNCLFDTCFSENILRSASMSRNSSFKWLEAVENCLLPPLRPSSYNLSISFNGSNEQLWTGVFKSGVIYKHGEKKSCMTLCEIQS